MKKILTPAIPLSALLFYFVMLGNSDKGQAAKESNTQTAPQGMLLVETDSLLPFYISAIEEPNINWQVYLQWLKGVFQDYPNIHVYAQPRDTMSGIWLQYNDPMLEEYFEHPAYQYYPVCGVSWLQVQSYLDWKTDRLNEAILIETDVIEFDMRHIVESNNFNTEAYLCGQYDPIYTKNDKRPIVPGTKKDKRQFKSSDGIFFPHYRLPTEAEWRAGHQFVSDQANYQYIKTSLKKESFLDPWIEYYKLDDDAKSNVSAGQVVFNRNFHYGISEWLIELENTLGGYRISEAEMLHQNGWLNFQECSPYDQYGEIKEKDSIGRLGFNYVQNSSINQPIYLTGPSDFIYRYDQVSYPNPHFRNPAYTDSILRRQYQAHYEQYKSNGYQGDFYFFLSNMYQMDTALYGRDSLRYTYQRILIKDNSKLRRRYIASNYRNPNAGTALLPNGESLPELGFRCVLPFTGVPVAKKYQVKWRD